MCYFDLSSLSGCLQQNFWARSQSIKPDQPFLGYAGSLDCWMRLQEIWETHYKMKIKDLTFGALRRGKGNDMFLIHCELFPFSKRKLKLLYLRNNSADRVGARLKQILYLISFSLNGVIPCESCFFSLFLRFFLANYKNIQLWTCYHIFITISRMYQNFFRPKLSLNQNQSGCLATHLEKSYFMVATISEVLLIWNRKFKRHFNLWGNGYRRD